MSKNYQQQVLNDYLLKREMQTLSLNLMNPTRAGLKEECLHVYAEKGAIKDDRVLRLFFGPVDAGNDYTQKIRNFDVDKYRPLVNFLKGETTDTQHKNIELLAWLIDYHAQALQKNDDKAVSVQSTVLPKPQDVGETFIPVEREGDAFDKVFAPQISVVLSKKVNQGIIACIAAVILLMGWSVFSKSSNQCMYWNGVEYKSIPCDEKSGDAAIIALDTDKVTHFKRITRPDTITRNSLGKVWYKKITRDSVEFYTAAGEYPLDHTKRLRPLTEYMLDKYILRQ
jgi:hypothetical protein